MKVYNNPLDLKTNIFSTKLLIEDTIFTSPTEDRTAILRGHPNQAKVMQVIDPRPPTPHLSTLSTELVLSRLLLKKLYF